MMDVINKFNTGSQADNNISCWNIPATRYQISDVHLLGEQYYYLIDYRHSPDILMLYADQKALQFHGKERKAFTFNYVVSSLHPDDRIFYSVAEQFMKKFYETMTPAEIVHYKYSYTIRIKDRTGEYKHIQHQSIPLDVDENGALKVAINVHTDVGHITNRSGNHLSIFGLNGRRSFMGIDPFDPEPSSDKSTLSNRENEILVLLDKGFTSNDIAKTLKISAHTVNTHRKNMLRKLNASNTAELLFIAREKYIA